MGVVDPFAGLDGARGTAPRHRADGDDDGGQQQEKGEEAAEKFVRRGHGLRNEQPGGIAGVAGRSSSSGGSVLAMVCSIFFVPVS